MAKKYCCRCKLFLNVTCFTKCAARADGLQSMCISCRKLYNTENQERQKTTSSKYYHTHKEKCLRTRALYYKNHKKDISDKDKLYRTNNKEKIQNRGKIYYQTNEDIIKHKQKIYRDQQGNLWAQRTKQYNIEHPEKAKITSRKHMAKRKGALKGIPYDKWLQSVLQQETFICSYCQQEFDIKYHQLDHFIPILGKDARGIDGLENVTNACPVCNNKKHNKSLLKTIQLFGIDTINRICEEIHHRLEAYQVSEALNT